MAVKAAAALERKKETEIRKKGTTKRRHERASKSNFARVRPCAERVENELGEIPEVTRLKDKRSHLNWYALNPANLTPVIKEAANK